MGKSDKTQMYSDQEKTQIYGDDEKRTKESAHQIKAGDQVILNNKEYTIIKLVSESSGEAVIYKAEDSEKNIIALKLYYEFRDPEQEPNKEALERIKFIDDPDILKLIDYGTEANKYKGKYCFEILHYAKGLDLLDVNDLKLKYTPEFLEKEVIPQIFKGIIKLHENKIFHCDLKPQNVFYIDTEQKEIVVGDYGSAKTFDYDAEKSSRKTTTVKGTDFYLPPEQARGFISEKNDYYSFGMILLHLFYPEKILSDNSKNISRLKFKQIIERQFEAKPIIDYNPKYKRLNSLIEGLTLANFNLRWGKEQVKQWAEGKNIKIVYSKSDYSKDGIQESQLQSINIGDNILSTPEELRAYILKNSNWYEELIEFKSNYTMLSDWVLTLHDGDRSKRSEFKRLIKDYSQDGEDFVAEAIIRFFIPEHPVYFGIKSFDFFASNDLMQTTAKAFSYLIFDLWENSSEKDLQLYIFRFELALRHLPENRQEAGKVLKILHKELDTKEKINAVLSAYNASAYNYVSKELINTFKNFLFEYMPTQLSLSLKKIDYEGMLYYDVGNDLSKYFSEIGINKTISKSTSEFIKIIPYDKSYNINAFYNKTASQLIKNISNKHQRENRRFLQADLDLFKKEFKSEFEKLFIDLREEYYKLNDELSKNLKKDDDIKEYLNDIKAVIFNNKYHLFYSAYHAIGLIKNRVEEIKEYEKTRLLNEKREKEKRKGREEEEREEREEMQVRRRRRTIRISIAVGLFIFIMAGGIGWTYKLIIYIKSEIIYKDFQDKNLALQQIEMITVKGGTFMMGSDEGRDNEAPVHPVTLNDFNISKYEITNEQFCWFLNLYGSDTVKTGEYVGEKMIYYSGDYKFFDWKEMFEEDLSKDRGVYYTKKVWRPCRGYENYPVIKVTWYGAYEFCKWAGGRLPSEAEWEYAARNGSKKSATKYAGSNRIDDVAWYSENSLERTYKVGKKDPNKLGIYDMSGNVWEWCEDGYDEYYYGRSEEKDPLNKTANIEKVIRGGGFDSDANNNTTTYRTGKKCGSWDTDLGFRLCIVKK